MGALTDPAVESGKGRGRGSQEGLMRTSCSLPPEQMESQNTSTPFISSMAKSTFISSMVPLSIFSINQDSIKGNYRPLSWPHWLYSCPEQLCWWVSVVRRVTLQGMSPDSNPAASQPWRKSFPFLSLLILDKEMTRPVLSVAPDTRPGRARRGALEGTAGRLPRYGI